MECGILSNWLGRIVVGAFPLQMVAAAVMVPLSRIRHEDAMLKTEFGQDWDNWAQAVPYLLIPGVY